MRELDRLKEEYGLEEIPYLDHVGILATCKQFRSKEEVTAYVCNRFHKVAQISIMVGLIFEDEEKYDIRFIEKESVCWNERVLELDRSVRKKDVGNIVKMVGTGFISEYCGWLCFRWNGLYWEARSNGKTGRSKICISKKYSKNEKNNRIFMVKDESGQEYTLELIGGGWIYLAWLRMGEKETRIQLCYGLIKGGWYDGDAVYRAAARELRLNFEEYRRRLQ